MHNNNHLSLNNYSLIFFYRSVNFNSQHIHLTPVFNDRGLTDTSIVGFCCRTLSFNVKCHYDQCLSLLTSQICMLKTQLVLLRLLRKVHAKSISVGACLLAQCNVMYKQECFEMVCVLLALAFLCLPFVVHMRTTFYPISSVHLT